ncbi:MAG: SRPBCC family protein [Flavobacteriales bacterium]
MRALKTILIILGVLIALAIIIGATGSPAFHYERSVTIAAPVDVVYPHVSSLGALDKWSPWNEKDPAMKKSLEGVDGTVGAVAKWEGNDDVGTGEQRIDSLVPNKLMRTHLTFHDWAMESTAGIALSENGDSTRVTWFMEGQNEGMSGFFRKVMGVFIDMDARLGKDFETGLGQLKTLAEEDAMKEKEATAKLLAAYTIETGDRPAALYVGLRKTIKWADMKQFFTEAFATTGAALKAAKVKPAGAPAGVYFKWDEVNHEADLLAGFPIAADAKGKVTGVTEYETPASAAYWIQYKGGYNSMGPAHEALSAKIEMDGKEHHTNVIEEYVTDPGSTPDSTQWQTNIIYLTK